MPRGRQLYNLLSVSLVARDWLGFWHEPRAGAGLVGEFILPLVTQGKDPRYTV